MLIIIEPFNIVIPNIVLSCNTITFKFYSGMEGMN